MPGAYPNKFFATQKDRDLFWNLRIGVMSGTFPALMAGNANLKQPIFAIGLGVIVWIIYIIVVFRYNLFGRLIGRIKWINEDD